MAIVGILLLILGLLLLLGGLFGTDYQVDGGQVTTEFLFFGTGPATIFVLGMVAAALILVGLWSLKLGAKQGWARRKERKRMDELSQQVKAYEEREQTGRGGDRGDKGGKGGKGGKGDQGKGRTDGSA